MSLRMGLANCQYDLVEPMFRFMYDVLDKRNKNKRKEKTEKWGDFGNLFAFDQTEFIEDYDVSKYNGLLEYGYIYYPD